MSTYFKKINVLGLLIISAFLFFGLTNFTAVNAQVSLDTSFGNNGQVITSFSNDANPSRMAVQSDDKIVVVGGASNGSNVDWGIARYNPDGSLDTTFGNGGIVIKDFGFGNDFLNAVAVQTDGKIVVGGHSKGTPTTCSLNPNFTHTICWTVARYNPDGTLDTTFGNGGIVFSSVRDGTDSELVNSLVIQTDGKIVAVGTAFNLGVVRYNTDGSEDFKDLIVIPNSFDHPATFFPSAPAGELATNGKTVLIQQDGKILVGGNAGNHMFLLKLNQNNSFDTTFGIGGLRRVGIMALDFTNDIALQQDNKIVSVGGGCTTTNCSTGVDTIVARFTASGSLDTTFDSDGIVINNFSTNGETANSVLIQPQDNKIIVGGQKDSNFAMHRFDINGLLDSTFGTNGTLALTIGQAGSISYIAFQPDFKLLAVGSVSNGSFNDWVLIRTTPVININQPPQINPIPDAIINEGDTYSASGSFSDPTSESWTGTIDYGDGLGIIPLTLNGTSFDLSHVYQDNGVYTVTVNIEDNQGEESVETAQITVNNAPPVVGTISASETYLILGNPTTVTTNGSFTDAGVLDTHTAVWDFGEGTSPGVVTETNGSGAVDGTFTYTVAGSYTVTLTVIDNDGGSGTSSNTITINVVTPTGAIGGLIDLVESFNLQQGINNSLDAKLDSALGALDDINNNNDQAAINLLNSFINAVEAQRGNHITNEQADVLIAAAQAIIDALSL